MKAAILAALVLASALAAQIPITITNPTGVPRQGEWVSFTVPDKAVPPGGTVKPYGWTWIAGDKAGARGRLVHIRTGKVDPFATMNGELLGPVDMPEGSDSMPKPAEYIPPTLLEEDAGASPIPGLEIGLPGGPVTWRPASLEVVEQGPARTVFRGRGRIQGTSFVATIWLYVYAASRVVPFELWLVNSDPRTTELVQEVQSIALTSVHGVFPAVDLLRARGGGSAAAAPGGIRIPLHPATWFGNGQGAAWTGRLIFWQRARGEELLTLRAATEGPLLGMAQPSAWAGSWGPWGLVPKIHPATFARARGRTDVVDLARRFFAARGFRGTLWANGFRSYGLANVPSSTGDQQGFGMTKLAPALSPPEGNAFHLLEILPAVLRDAGRGSFFHEADGSPLKLELHPDWWTWGLVTHWHPGVSSDRLGKLAWAKDSQNVLAVKDFAHASSNSLAGWTVLTGSHLGRAICSAEITAGSRFSENTGMGETRAWGRTPLAMIWDYLATGDERVRTVFLERLWKHRRWAGYLEEHKGHQVAPLGWSNGDGRWWAGKLPFWMPWQEGLAIPGIDAGLELLPNATVEAALLEICRSFIAHGWKRVPAEGGGLWWTFWVVEWKKDGTPITDLEYLSTEHARPGDGGIYEWAWPGVIVARRRLAASGKFPDLVKKADEILAEHEARRLSNPPRPAFDRASEWETVK